MERNVILACFEICSMDARVALPTLLVLGIITGALAVYAATPSLGSTITSTKTQVSPTFLAHTLTDTSTVLSTVKSTVISTATATAYATQTQTSTAYSTQTLVISSVSTTTSTSTSTSTVTSTLETGTVTETATQLVTVTRTDLVPGQDLMTFSGSGDATSPPFSADHFNMFIEMSVNASTPSQGAAISWYMFAVNGGALVGQGSVNTLGVSTSWAFGLTPGDAYYVKVVGTNALWSLTVSGES